MWNHHADKIAKMIHDGDKRWLIVEEIERAYADYSEHYDVVVHDDAHRLAVAVMQMEGTPVTVEMDYDDINEVWFNAERRYISLYDAYEEMAADADWHI